MTSARHAALIPLLLLVATTSACERQGVTAAGVLSDSTYVAAMAELQRIHDERSRAPLPPIPMPTGLNGAAATPEAQRRRDAIVRHRADSLVVADSAKRIAVFARYHVTVAALEETARVYAADPAKVLRINDAIIRRVTALDAATNVAKANAAKARAQAASPTPRKP